MSVSFDFGKGLEESHINKFKCFIDRNFDFVYNKYRNINGKNKWSIICSCMDWITVSTEYINLTEIKANNANIISMQVYSMITSYDIIIESVIQLHRVFFDTDKSPFNDETAIFNKEVSDKSYFKQIRAMFGAHPVNLTGLDGDKGKQYFASWSSARLASKHDMSVFLYSNIPGEPDIDFGIDFELIHKLALKYFNHLNEIMEEIEKQYRESLCEKRVT